MVKFKHKQQVTYQEQVPVVGEEEMVHKIQFAAMAFAEQVQLGNTENAYRFLAELRNFQTDGTVELSEDMGALVDGLNFGKVTYFRGGE